MGCLSETIKECRKLHSLSLQDVATASGLAKTHVWHLERGRSTNPTIETVYHLANAIKVKPRVLAELAMADIAPK